MDKRNDNNSLNIIKSVIITVMVAAIFFCWYHNCVLQDDLQ
jgi:hypothetical protein